METTIKLGQKVRDKLSGAEGTAIGMTEWLYGCRRVTVQPFATKEDKPTDAFVVDEPQLEVVEDTPAPKATPKHGPRTDAGRRVDAGRK